MYTFRIHCSPCDCVADQSRSTMTFAQICGAKSTLEIRHPAIFQLLKYLVSVFFNGRGWSRSGGLL